MNQVPCGDCSLCCEQGQIKLMLPFDYYEKAGAMIPRFVSIPHDQPDREGSSAIGLKADGKTCVYLKEGRCVIHNDKPKLCKEFDCRNLARMFPTREALSPFKGVSIEVWQRGKNLLEEAA